MKILGVKSLEIPDVKVIKFARFCDDRGYFTETYRQSDFSNNMEVPSELMFNFMQANESFSKPGTFRGLHFQWNPHMGKLVRCVKGFLIDFALDIRLGSPTFGKMVAYELTEIFHNKDYSEWIWVPPGFAHGTLLLDESIIEYFCTGEYSQGCESGISIYADDIDWEFITKKDKYNKLTWLESIINITDKDKEAHTMRTWKQSPEAQNFIYKELS